MITNLNEYQEWKGKFKTSGWRFLPIFRFSFRHALKRKFSKPLLIFSLINPLFFIAAVYITSRSELKPFFEFPVFSEIRNFALILENFFNQMFFFLLLLTIFFFFFFFSEEYRTNALPLYFSRPISRWDYLFAKIGVILFLTLIYTFVPALLLVILRLVFEGSVGLNYLNWLGILIVPLTSGIFFSSMMIFVSVLVKKTRLAELTAFFGYYFLSAVAFSLFQTQENRLFYLLSPNHCLKSINSFFFSRTFENMIPVYYALPLIAALSGFFIFWVNYLLNKKEQSL